MEFLGQHLTWKEHIPVSIISSKIARAIFLINRLKHFIPHKALKSLHYTLIHITYGIQCTSMGQWKHKEILQKRALRIINNRGYSSHIDPIFKSEQILKILDIYKLHVSLFMYDFHYDLLPKSFKHIAVTKNLDKGIRITRPPSCKRDLEHIFRLSELKIFLQEFGTI